MRNTKNAKGFTLVELIVVIAIIGVLAAILVPSMLGFVRDARISSANSNAHAAYTGMQAWLTKYATAHPTNGFATITVQGTANATSLPGTVSGGSVVGGCELGEYLGLTFKGYAYADLDASGSSIDFVLWTADNTLNPCGTAQLDAPTQESNAKAGKIIGCHPLA